MTRCECGCECGIWCGRELGMPGSPVCPDCGDTVSWGLIQTGTPGNWVQGACACAYEWRWDQRGSWYLAGLSEILAQLEAGGWAQSPRLHCGTRVLVRGHGKVILTRTGDGRGVVDLMSGPWPLELPPPFRGGDGSWAYLGPWDI